MAKTSIKIPGTGVKVPPWALVAGVAGVGAALLFRPKGGQEQGDFNEDGAFKEEEAGIGAGLFALFEELFEQPQTGLQPGGLAPEGLPSPGPVGAPLPGAGSAVSTLPTTTLLSPADNISVNRPAASRVEVLQFLSRPGNLSRFVFSEQEANQLQLPGFIKTSPTGQALFVPLSRVDKPLSPGQAPTSTVPVKTTPTFQQVRSPLTGRSTRSVSTSTPAKKAARAPMVGAPTITPTRTPPAGIPLPRIPSGGPGGGGVKIL